MWLHPLSSRKAQEKTTGNLLPKSAKAVVKLQRMEPTHMPSRSESLEGY